MDGNLTAPEILRGVISSQQNSLKGRLSSGGTLFGSMARGTPLNYDNLINLPSLNGVTLQGAKVSEDFSLPKVIFNTTENWDADTTTVSEENTLYIYTDYQTTESGNILGIKIGDGKAFIVDLPFSDTIMQQHMANTDIHVTPEEKAFWNSKNRAVTYGENLILTEL